MTPVPPLRPGQRAGSGDWTAAGAHPVAPGVHRIPLPLPNDGLRAVNVYAIEEGDRIALIDAGWHRDECWAALGRGLEAIGASPRDVARVLVTHVHRDHYGQATRLRDTSGARVLLGAGERGAIEAMLAEGGARAFREWRRRQLHRWGAPALAGELEAELPGGLGGDPSTAVLWGAPDVYAEEGMLIELRSRTLEVIPTPGHTRGHVVFADRAHGLLFSGDHVLPQITPSIGLERLSDGRALISYLASLSRVRSLPVELVLPAHGPEFTGLAERVDALTQHHSARLGACLTAVRSGSTTVLAVAEALRWTRREHAYASLDSFNRLLAVTETAAHLELLVSDGRLAATERDGVRHFSLPAGG